MIRLLLTPPFRFNVAPDALDREGELAPVLAGYGIALTADPGTADLELCGGYYFEHTPVWRLPKHRVVIITPEPPQPDYLEAAYTDHGFAAVLTPLSLTAHAPDGMAYFTPPRRLTRSTAKAGARMALMATFRYNQGNAGDGAFMRVKINGGRGYSCRTLAFARSFTGLAVKHHFPELIDLYGRYWPQGAALSGNTREAPDWREQKLNLLSGYDFNLCWENSVIPGYVTEKIWDSITAGSLPLYFGPPEFHDLLPKDSIIDCRRFLGREGLDVEALLGEVLDMSEAERARRVKLLDDWHAAIPEDAKKTSALAAAHILGREIAAAATKALSEQAA